MEYLPKLTAISAVLSIGLLILMHFNDLHLLFTDITELWTEEHVYIDIWMKYYGMFKNLGSYISKTIHLIAMKLTGVD